MTDNTIDSQQFCGEISIVIRHIIVGIISIVAHYITLLRRHSPNVEHSSNPEWYYSTSVFFL